MPRGVNDFDTGRIQGRNAGNANSSNIVSPGIVTDGLVLHLDAGNYQSYPIAGATWYDLSDRRNNGTLTNNPTYVRDGGGAISLDGTNDFVSLPDVSGVTDFTISDNYTVDFWVYINSTQNNQLQNDNFLVEKWDTAFAPGYPFVFRYIRTGTGSPCVHVAVYNGTSAQFASASVSTDTWINYCGVFDWKASLLSVYRNAGAPNATTTINLTGTITNASNVYLGSRGTSTSGLFTGSFGSLKIYNRALSQPEVQQNFNATRARFNI